MQIEYDGGRMISFSVFLQQQDVLIIGHACRFAHLGACEQHHRMCGLELISVASCITL